MRFGGLALGLLLSFMVASDCTSAFARGGHGGGGHSGGYHGGYHRRFYGGYGWGGGYGRHGYGGYGYNNQQQNLAWTQAHENPLSLGPYSSVPRQITPANQSYVVRDYSWPSSSKLADTQPPAQLAGKGGATR